MRRIFWFAMGLAVGITVVRKAAKAAGQLTPDSIAARAGNALTDVGASVRSFTDEVRRGMREREVELRESAGFDGDLGNRPEPSTRELENNKDQ